MRIGCRIDQLGIDADLIARSPDAPFEHITHSQLTADLLGIDGLVAVGEGGVARNHQHVRDTREIGRHVLGDAVGKILLLRVVAEVCKGQDDDRQPRRGSERRT